MHPLIVAMLGACHREPPCLDSCCAPAWVAALEDPATVLVAADGEVERAGAPIAALSTLQEGFDAASSIDGPRVVVLERGTYFENLVLGGVHKGIHVHGQCRDETIIDGSIDRARPTLLVDGPDRAAFEFTDLTFTGGRGGIQVIGGSFVGERLNVVGNRWVGVEATSVFSDLLCEPATLPSAGGVDLTDSRVAETKPGRGDTPVGVGVAVGCGMTAQLTGVDIEDNLVSGLVIAGSPAAGGPTASLEDVTIRGTRAGDTWPNVAGGIQIEDATVEWTRGTIEDVSYSAAAVIGSAAHVDATEVTFRDAEDAGVIITEQSDAVFTDCVVEQNPLGIVAAGGATVTAIRTTVMGAPQGGIYSLDLGTTVTVTDSVVTGTGMEVPTARGTAVGALDRATLVAIGVQVVDTRGVGIEASAGATLVLDDVEVEGTRMAADLDASAGVGVLIVNQGHLTATGLTVRQTEGDGLVVASGSDGTCTRCTIVQNDGMGAAAYGGDLVLTDAQVTGNGSVGIFAARIPELEFWPAALTLDASTVGPHPLAAVYLAGPGAFRVIGSSLSGSTSLPGLVGPWGNALFAGRVDEYRPPAAGPWDGVEGLEVVDTTLVAGVEPVVALVGASGTFVGNTWPAADVDVVQLACAETVPAIFDGPAPSTDSCPPFDAPFALLAPTYLPAPPVVLQ